ncbi:hypothetical protein B0H13DRAFT_1859065 [Mycena leptocephala]|nr:hypothetical protein B0H13DRAFT_1859065 [Mycena leptocephala]
MHWNTLRYLNSDLLNATFTTGTVYRSQRNAPAVVAHHLEPSLALPALASRVAEPGIVRRYEWVILFLTQEGVWRRSRQRRIYPNLPVTSILLLASHLIEIKRTQDSEQGNFTESGNYQPISSIFLTMYAQNLNSLSELVEEARNRYVDINQHRVTIHLADSPRHYGPASTWNTVKHRNRRSLKFVATS